MKKILIPLLIAAIFLAGFFIIRFVIGGNEDAWVCSSGQWVKHGNPAYPAPQTGCGQAAVTTSPVSAVPGPDYQSVNEEMSKVLSQKYNRPENSFTIAVSSYMGPYAKGTINYSEGGGGLWFASLVNGTWKLVFDGNGIVTCNDLKNYPDFPTNIIPQCLDETGQLIAR